MSLSHVPKIQLCNASKITDTLQGSIWRASLINKPNDSVVIKVVIQKPNNPSISIMNKQIYYDIQENILLEQSIHKYLTQKEGEASPSSIVKFIDFFQIGNELNLVMEDGGVSLFKFARDAHKLIKQGIIELNHWKQVVRIIFRQMLESIEYIHSHNICHNDISLENFLINNIGTYIDEKSGKLQFKMDYIRIKLCDFGLAELHKNSECRSKKHCGKTKYKSMEVINKKEYYFGKKNDIWCAGICLFVLSFGCYPWPSAYVHDAVFISRYPYITNGGIVDMLIALGLLMYIDVNNIDLFQCMFKTEAHRISVEQIKRHKYVR